MINDVRKIIFVNMTCNFRLGSEWDVGWNFLLLLAKHYSIQLIAAEEDRSAIEAIPVEHFPYGLQVHYIFADWKLPSRKSNNVLGRQIYFSYLLRRWQKKAYQIASEIIQNEKIDLIYKLTPCGFRASGLFYKLGIPSLWGPVTGYFKSPTLLILKSDMPLSMRIKFGFRVFFSACKFMIDTPNAIAGYSKIISGTASFKEILEKKYGVESPILVQSGISINKIKSHILRRDRERTLNVVWCGSIIPRKNLNTVLRAFADNSIKDLPIHLHVIGGGADMKKNQLLCKELKLSNDKIIFYGRCSRKKVMDLMNMSHLFVLLSYSDMSPGVIAEAYASGLPVIALNHEGFSLVVQHEKTGLLIDACNMNQVVSDLVKSLLRFYYNEDFRAVCAENALKYAVLLSYEHKEEQLISCCEEAIENFQKRKKI